MNRSIGWRWKLGALAWASLSLAVWFAGDAIALGGARPLEAPAARLALIALVGLAWLGWELWRVRQALRANQRLLDGLLRGVSDAHAAERAAHELAVLRQRFEQALAVLRKARFRAPTGERRTVAELPWYMFIGAPGSGKTTALLNAGLRFPLGDPRAGEALQGIGGTRNCDWWFTDEAVLLDTAGRYTTQDSDREADAAAWLGFLDLLKTFRPRQPLNGVLVTLSLSDLAHWDDEELQRYAEHVRERLAELRERLGVRLPVYVLVTKTDLLAGFNEFFSGFDAAQRAQVWGVTFDPAQPAPEARFGEEFARLERRLYAMLPARLHEERDLQRRAAIYRFPQQFRVSGPLVERFLAAAFGDLGEREPAFVRGVYFTSGTQEGSPIDRVLGTLARTFNLERKVQPPFAGTGKSFFLRRLLREVILAEAGLAGVDPAQERRRRTALAAAAAALAAATLGLAAVWTASYLANRDLVVAARASTSAVKAELAAQAPLRPGDEARLLALLERVAGLAESIGAQGRLLDVGFGQRDKLAAQATRAYRNALRESLLPHAVRTLEADLRAQPAREALEAYVALYEPAPPDAQALAAVLARRWRLPEERARALARHLRAALQEQPLVLPHPRDEELVQAAGRRLGPGARL
ncbi:MAG TPA: type VI secretion system membrane subunit TssM [Burkholderiales bacterium]